MEGIEKLLLLGDLDCEMGGDGVGELGVVGDLAERGDHLLGHLLVELHIAFKLGHTVRASASVSCASSASAGRTLVSASKKLGAIGKAFYLRALDAFDQNLDGSIGQFEKLQHLRDGTDLVDRRGAGSSSAGFFAQRAKCASPRA